MNLQIYEVFYKGEQTLKKKIGERRNGLSIGLEGDVFAYAKMMGSYVFIFLCLFQTFVSLRVTAPCMHLPS